MKCNDCAYKQYCECCGKEISTKPAGALNYKTIHEQAEEMFGIGKNETITTNMFRQMM